MGSATEDIIRNLPVPQMVRIRQQYSRPRITDIPREVQRQLDRPELMALVQPGMQIAITAGSRGVANIALIIREIADICKARGAHPFVIPAMGSHGGATAAGQREILTGYQITEENVGCPIRCTMEVRQICRLEDTGEPVFIDRYAAEADGIIVVGRVKPHTLFQGRVESGICKMMAIGLGKQKGAEECHNQGPYKMAENIQRYGYAVLRHAKVLFALAAVENAYDETAILRSLSRDEIYGEEPKLLAQARALMPGLPFESCDVLIIDEIGKHISGDGMDPNITGRFLVPAFNHRPDPQRIVVLDIAPESHGNGTGLGFADMTTQRAAGKFDREKTYPNGLTSHIMDLTRIPPVFRTDRLCIQAALKTVYGLLDTSQARIIRLKNTKHTAEFEISVPMLADVLDDPNIQILSGPAPLPFDTEGNLL